ncbi:unnamed protein product [Danaus chrysippus]|uniref:(African queen) hypothetical protein n=1 Tax=Danaus chrysippus TaxID=151541 RepID=A0A8J2WDB5_9NEOP|nr:unnamed protein product [Danaus chrysippus]
MMSLKFLFVFGVLAVSLRNARAISDEDRNKIHTAVLPHVAECSANFGVTEDDIKAAKEAGTLGTFNPCLMGCVLKKIEVIDDKGLFDVDKAVELTKKYFSDEADQKKAEEIITTCKSVNDKEVGDGEKGCERAGLLLQCFLPFKDAFLS